MLMLGHHEESFIAHTWTWCSQQYLEHWRQGLTRALGGQPSALITDMRTPAQSSHLVWWPVWKLGRELVFQNQALFFAKQNVAGAHIDVEHLYSLIGRHTSLNNEGIPISEWVAPISDVEGFLASYPSRED